MLRAWVFACIIEIYGADTFNDARTTRTTDHLLQLDRSPGRSLLLHRPSPPPGPQMAGPHSGNPAAPATGSTYGDRPSSGCSAQRSGSASYQRPAVGRVLHQLLPLGRSLYPSSSLKAEAPSTSGPHSYSYGDRNANTHIRNTHAN